MARNLFTFLTRNEPSCLNKTTPIFTFYCRSLKLTSKVQEHDETLSKPSKYIIKPKNILSSKERKRRALRLRWENTALFGPLLKSGTEKKKEMKMGIMKIGSEVVNLTDIQYDEKEESFLKPEIIEERVMLNDEDVNVYNKAVDITDFPMINPWRFDESRMLYENPSTTDIKKYPSVTRILNETMSEESRLALERWKNSMIEKLGEEGFATYQANLFKFGKNLHTNIADLMLGKDEQELSILPENEGHWKSLEKVFPKVRDVALIEHSVYHPHLKYKGVVDCVAVYKNKLLVIDWKTSKKLKSSIYSIFDNPIQVVAYLGALNFDKSVNLQLDSAAVIVAYENASPAHVHLLDRNTCLKYWGKWLVRLNQFLSKSSCV